MINQDLERRIEAYRGNPQALMQRYQQSQQLIDLLALQRIKSEKEAAARQIQMQMGQQPTVAEQREAEVMDLTRQEVAQRVGEVGQQKQQQQQQAMQKMMGGLAAAPGAQAMMPTQAMAAGGIVAFNGEDESLVESENMGERARRQLREKGSIYSPYYGLSLAEIQDIVAQEKIDDQLAAEQAQAAREGFMRERRQAAARRASADRGTFAPEGKERTIGEAAKALGSDVSSGIRGLLPAAPVDRRVQMGSQNEFAVPAPRPAAPPYVDSDIAERADRMTGMVRPSGETPPPGAGATPTPTSTPTLQRTHVPTVPAVDQGGPGGGIAPAGDPKLREALARMMDPQRAEQERIRAQAAAKAAYDLTPEERARYDRHMAELEQLDKQRFSPEALRRRRWEDFAAGAVNKESMAGALGGGAASAVRGGRTMEEAQREALLQRQKQAEAMLERQRGIRKGVFEASEKAGEEATKGLPAALQTAGSLETAALKSSDEAKNRAAALERLGIERASAEKIALLNAESQAEIAKATREGTLLNKQAQLLDGINRREDLAIQELRTKNPAYNALLAKQKNGMLLPDELKQLQTMESGFAREEKAIRELFNARRDAVSMAGFRVLKD
jgi:hypothetical protein